MNKKPRATIAPLLMCERCSRLLPEHQINVEARIHHHASAYECVDRRSCERARRRIK